MSIIEQLLRIIAPHHCLGCGLEGQLLCSACRNTLPAIPPRCYRCFRPTAGYRTCPACSAESPLSAVFVATEYAGLAKEVIHHLKFERARAAAEDLAAALVPRLDLKDVGVITYVPTAPSRVRTRGYDQAQLLAKAVARRVHLPCATLLARSGKQRQVGNNRVIRKQQMKTAFYTMNSRQLLNRHVLLIDDVLTTGSTCEAAAAALKARGVERVSVAVFAAA